MINFKDETSLTKDIQLQYQPSHYKFKDERLITYYEAEDLRYADQKLMIVQRIENSQTYVVIFPTGLLFQMIALSSMMVQSKIQLNLKADETIIDSNYCVSTDGVYHCFWFIDQRLQVWKCYGERNQNESNWTLTKKIVSSGLYFKRFMVPAMTYENYFLCHELTKLSHIDKILKKPKTV